MPSGVKNCRKYTMTDAQQLQLLEDLVPACDLGSVGRIQEVMNKHFYSLTTARSVFCVSDPKYDRDFLPLSRGFLGRGYLHSLLASRRVLHMMNFDEDRDFRFTFTISLDTQFVSYLRSRFRQRSVVGQDDAITEAFQYLAPFRSGIDVTPYLFENNDRLDSPEVAESLGCFVQFKQAAEKPLIEEGRIEPTLPAAKQEEQINDMLSFVKGEDWQALATNAKQNWRVAYITLLHAVAIELEHHNKSSANKMKLLIEQLDEVGLLPKHEIHFVRALFERGSQEKFFRKAQANNADLATTLSGMAWDLAHYRTVVSQVSHVSRLSPDHARFVSPFILTFDQPLQSLLEQYHINGLITYMEGSRVKYIVIYSMGAEEALSAGLNKSMHLLEPDRRQKRLERGRHFINSADRQDECVRHAEGQLMAALAKNFVHKQDNSC
jgi:hypothetical protein